MRRWLAIPALAAAILAGAVATAPRPAASIDYPTRPIRLIVPYPAGGGNDVVARLISERMSVSLGQPIVIGAGPTGENVADRAVRGG